MQTRRSTRMSRRLRACALAVIGLCAVASGCSARQAPPAAADEPASARDPRYVITREDLADSRVVGLSVLEAIRILRPMFLMDAASMSKGSSSVTETSINGGRPRPLRELIGIPVSEVAEIQYLSIGQGQQRFGVRPRMGPIILVTLLTT